MILGGIQHSFNGVLGRFLDARGLEIAAYFVNLDGKWRIQLIHPREGFMLQPEVYGSPQEAKEAIEVALNIR